MFLSVCDECDDETDADADVDDMSWAWSSLDYWISFWEMCLMAYLPYSSHTHVARIHEPIATRLQIVTQLHSAPTRWQISHHQNGEFRSFLICFFIFFFLFCFLNAKREHFRTLASCLCDALSEHKNLQKKKEKKIVIFECLFHSSIYHMRQLVPYTVTSPLASSVWCACTPRKNRTKNKQAHTLHTGIHMYPAIFAARTPPLTENCENYHKLVIKLVFMECDFYYYLLSTWWLLNGTEKSHAKYVTIAVPWHSPVAGWARGRSRMNERQTATLTHTHSLLTTKRKRASAMHRNDFRLRFKNSNRALV